MNALSFFGYLNAIVGGAIVCVWWGEQFPEEKDGARIGYVALLFLLPITLLALGTPIFALFLAGAALTFAFFLTVQPVALHQIMFGGLENYALLAVPFFIFAGELMGGSGIADRLIAWVLALIGRVPGSLGVATVGAGQRSSPLFEAVPAHRRIAP